MDQERIAPKMMAPLRTSLTSHLLTKSKRDLQTSRKSSHQQQQRNQMSPILEMKNSDDSSIFEEIHLDSSSVSVDVDDDAVNNIEVSELLLEGAKNNDKGRNNKNNLPRIVGHRGALYAHPENTIEGFKHCCDLGIDSVEFGKNLLTPTIISSF